MAAKDVRRLSLTVIFVACCGLIIYLCIALTYTTETLHHIPSSCLGQLRTSLQGLHHVQKFGLVPQLSHQGGTPPSPIASVPPHSTLLSNMIPLIIGNGLPVSFGISFLLVLLWARSWRWGLLRKYGEKLQSTNSPTPATQALCSLMGMAPLQESENSKALSIRSAASNNGPADSERSEQGNDNQAAGSPLPSRLWFWVTSPARNFVTWVQTLCHVFGGKFILLTVFGAHLMRGFLDGSGSSGHGFLIIEQLAYVQLKTGAATKSVLGAVSGAPWALKPIFGILSDVLVMGGLRRVPWIIITAVLSTIGFICTFVFGAQLGPVLLCLCFFFIHMQTAWTDLMVEAAYSEKMNRHPEYAADIVSWIWTGIGVFTTLGVLLVGPGLQLFGPFRMAGFGIPVAAAIIIPASLGWLDELPHGSIKWGVDWEVLKKQRKLFLCTLILSAVVLLSSGCAILHWPLAHQATVVCLGSAIVILSSILLLPATLWKPMLFLFLSTAVHINTYGFVDNFFLDAATPQESLMTGYPVCTNCPHFSNTFYVTVIGICDSIFMLVGSWLFNDTMSNWTYRSAMFLTQVIMSGSLLLDIIQFERLNLAWGIPDTVFIIFRHAIQNTVSMVHFIPSTILISKLCPEGVASTVFSLLAGFSNFGMAISSYLGAYTLDRIGLGSIGKGEVDVFRNMPLAVIINALSPMVALLFLPLLVPDARMSEKMPMPDFGEEVTYLTGRMSEGSTKDTDEPQLGTTDTPKFLPLSPP